MHDTDGKAAFVPIFTSRVLSLLMSAAIRWVNLGIEGFLLPWLRAWPFAFPLATATATALAVPAARRRTVAIVRALDAKTP